MKTYVHIKIYAWLFIVTLSLIVQAGNSLNVHPWVNGSTSCRPFTPWNIEKWKSLNRVPMDFTGQNTGVGRHSLLQGIFPTQGSNPGLPYCRWILYQLSHWGSLLSSKKEWTIDTCSNLNSSHVYYDEWWWGGGWWSQSQKVTYYWFHLYNILKMTKL